MALITGLIGVLGRFAGKILTTALGWASVLLFGRVSKNQQTLLAGVTFISLGWLAAVVGVLFPDVGTVLLAAVPRPDFVSEDVVRIVMLAIAIVAPLVVGGLVLAIQPADRRPHGSGLVTGVLRGYPLALALDVTLVWLGVVAVWLKARSLSRRWEDAHVPLVVKPGRYEAVVGALEDALDGAGLAVDRRPASKAISIPTQLVVAAAGQSLGSLVPDEFAKLVREDLEIQVHPSDLAMTGAKGSVGTARTSIVTRLTSSEAYLTQGAEAQRLEDRLEDLAKRTRRLGTAGDRGVRNGLAEVDAGLDDEAISFDDWQILMRSRLQVERDLLAAEQERRLGGIPIVGEVVAGFAEAGAGAGADARGGSGAASASDPRRTVGRVVADLVELIREGS